MTAHDRVLEALRAHGCRGRGRDWTCPSHEDGRASLRITKSNDRVLIKCFAGCETEDVVAALGLALADLFDTPMPEREPDFRTTYCYVDENGELLFQVCRFVPKDFRQRRPDGRGGWTWNLDGVRRLLYRLPAVVEPPRPARGCSSSRVSATSTRSNRPAAWRPATQEAQGSGAISTQRA
jgi:putative DNA primase/helicase